MVNQTSHADLNTRREYKSSDLVDHTGAKFMIYSQRCIYGENYKKLYYNLPKKY
jgi:hypothetical protein